MLGLIILSSLLAVYFINKSGNKSYVPVLFVADSDGQWDNSRSIGIFMNEKFGDSIIEPGQKGSYAFIFENKNSDSITYNILFLCDNKYNIGLKYKLKRDGAYIVGYTEYVPVDELLYENLTIEATSTSLFELEWYWEENDEIDTIAGENEASYTLYIQLEAWLDEQ